MGGGQYENGGKDHRLLPGWRGEMSGKLTVVIEKQEPLTFAIKGPADKIIRLLEFAADNQGDQNQPLLDQATTLSENAVRYAHDPQVPE